MEETVSPYLNQTGTGKKKNTGVIIAAAVIIVALVGAFIILRQPKKTEPKKTAVVEQKTPSPTVKPKIDKKTVKFQVLNGTGTPGQAGTAVKALEEAGYSPDNIKTGNAEEFNNTVTTIAAKDGFSEVAEDVKNALKSIFDKVDIDTTPLDKESEFDIVVTTGGKKFVEATPTVTSATPTTAEATPTEGPTGTPTPSPTPIP